MPVLVFGSLHRMCAVLSLSLRSLAAQATAERAASGKSQCCASLRGARTCSGWAVYYSGTSVRACMRAFARVLSPRPSTFFSLFFFSSSLRFPGLIVIDFRVECVRDPLYTASRNFKNFLAETRAARILCIQFVPFTLPFCLPPDNAPRDYVSGKKTRR
jgi:hypothetical protein